MATSIVEQIGAAAKTRIETITTGNGYEFSVDGATRPTRQGGYTPAQLHVVITADMNEVEERTEEAPCGYEQWRVPFHFDVLNNGQVTKPDAVDTLVNKWGADVAKALSTDLTFGGLALGTGTPTPGMALEGETGKFAGARVTLPVEFRHLRGNPYSQ